MKPAPSFVATVTAVAALGAGVLLAAEDRVLFEPQHAMLVGLLDDADALLQQQPLPRAQHETRRPVTTRAGSAAQERR